MRIPFTLCSVALGTTLSAQDPVIQGIIDAVQIDSMMHYVEQISGDVSVNVGAGPEFIITRHLADPGDALSQAFLEQKFTELGYTPTIQTFPTSLGTGHNILVSKTGTVYPDSIVILCGHYDTYVHSPYAAPAADDDGSGCGAVLEAARILSDIEFEYTIVFALWDEEEQGKLGSIYYASHAAGLDVGIKWVLNMDAIAYDGNGDTKARIHTKPIAHSLALADSVFAIRDRYAIDLDLILTNPGAIYSDHASFWSNQYSAVLIIEEFGADGNPQYHTPNDRVNLFDVPYYEKLARLSIGTLATLAVPVTTTAIHGAVDPITTKVDLRAYPNPASTDMVVCLEAVVADRYTMQLINAMGQEVAVLHNGPLAAGKHNIALPVASMAPGAYSVVVRSTGGVNLAVHVVRTP